MLLSTWRPAIINWLVSKTSITTFDLRTPSEPGDTSLFLPPLRNVRVFEDGLVKGEAVQEIYLTTRFDHSVKYSDLPINVIEATYISLCYGLHKDFQEIADLENLEIRESELTITVNEDQAGVESTGNYGDWLVTLRIYAAIEWGVEAETTDILDGNLDDVVIDAQKINGGIYRQNIDGLSEVLDYSGPIQQQVD